MKPRYIGKQVTAHHPRGGRETGTVVSVSRMSGYGLRLTLDTGFSCSVADVIRIGESELDIMARHYLVACIWADSPEGTHPRATAKAMEAARKHCAAFLAHIGPERLQAIRDAYANGYGAHADCGDVHPYMAALGHDLWLSRQGHGVGFADRDTLPEALRDWLDSQCGWQTPFPEVCPEFYRGWLYIHD